MATGISHYVGTTDPMSRYADGAVRIPEGSDPGPVIKGHPILGSEIAAVPMMRASYKDPTGAVGVPERYIVRVADDHGLGPVGKRYNALQPADIADMLSGLHRDFGLGFETAMLLEDGQTFLTQAKLRTVDLGPLASTARAKRDTGGRDIVNGYLTIADNYVGKRNATCGAAQTRAVCENTAAMAMRESGQKEALFGRPIRHTGDVKAKLDLWEHAIADALTAFERFEEFAVKSSETRISRPDAMGIIEALIPLPQGAAPGKAQAKRDGIFTAFDNGIGNVGRTAWDLYNGVTEWANWQAPVRGANPDTARFESLMFDGLGELVEQAEQHIRVFVGL